MSKRFTEWYDKQGNPMSDILAWGKLFENKEYSKIKQDNIGSFFISTVWLGIDHNFGMGKPLIFESMVFNADEEDMERYSTEAEAIAGHEKLVEKYKKLVGNND